MKQLFIILLGSYILMPFNVSAQGFTNETTDKTVKFFGYIQTQYEYAFLGEDLEGNNMDESKFYFNRLRVGVMGKIPYDFSYSTVVELSPTLGGPYLLGASISYNRFAPYAKISIGQLKSPFGMELNTPCHKLPTVNRSITANNLSGHFRDMGLMVSGSTGKLSILGAKTENFFTYSLAIFNGTGQNLTDNNLKKDILGRITLHPWNFLKLGASYRSGKHPSIIVDVEEDERSAYGLDLSLKYKNIQLQSEYISSSDIGSFTTGGGCCSGPVQLFQGSKNRHGFMAQAMYMSPWNLQAIVKFEQYDPNSDADASQTPTEFYRNIITYGINYFFNENTRLQLNYLYCSEETGNVEYDNDALLIQFQVNF